MIDILFLIIALPGLKVFKEYQVEADDAAELVCRLDLRGFSPLFRKEKIRESHAWKNSNIYLNKPIHPRFPLESEASEEEIAEVAPALDLDSVLANGNRIQLSSIINLVMHSQLTFYPD